MMPFGFLKLRAIGGQIAALVIVSILVLHLIITAIFLAHRLDDSRHEPWHIHGELSAAVELRQRFPGITDNAMSRECARTIAGWKPRPLKQLPKRPRVRRIGDGLTD